MSSSTTVSVSLVEARRLALKALQRIGFTDKDASTIADNLISCEFSGHPSAGLTRIISMNHSFGPTNPPQNRIRVTHETDVSAQIAGHNTVGFLVAHEATQMAIEKTREKGIAVVGASGSWGTGHLASFAEMATRHGLFCIIAAHTAAHGTPQDAFRSILGASSICMGCPSWQSPILWDMGVSFVAAEQTGMPQGLHRSLGHDKDSNGSGHSTGQLAGLAMMLPLIGALAGPHALQSTSTSDRLQLDDTRHLIIVIDPRLFQPWHMFLNQVDSSVSGTSNASAFPDTGPARSPNNGSRRPRLDFVTDETLQVDLGVLSRVQQIGNEPSPALIPRTRPNQSQ